MPDPDGLLLYNDLERIVLADEGHMPVSVHLEHAGDRNMQADVRAIIGHVLADRPGDWRVSIMDLERMISGNYWPEWIRTVLYA